MEISKLSAVFEIKTLVEIARSFAKEDYQEGFECETTREYRAYVKGQCDALDAVINKLQQLVEGALYAEENSTGE